MHKIIRRAILAGCAVALFAAPVVRAELSQREQQEQAQRAYEASRDTYNDVARDAQHEVERWTGIRDAAEKVEEFLNSLRD
jgi:hypothetical protein